MVMIFLSLLKVFPVFLLFLGAFNLRTDEEEVENNKYYYKENE